MIAFIAALYNEEQEIIDLIKHVSPYVDKMYFVDDGSTDDTYNIVLDTKVGWGYYNPNIEIEQIDHTGLPETVKNQALQMVPNGSWVLMLDADERFITPLSEIVEFIKSPASKEVDYVYFEQHEIIDGQHVRTFQKCKLFRKESITFSSDDIHKDDQFKGNGAFFGWQVAHRKSSYKQIQREQEYLETYKRLLDEGKIDQGRYEWLVNLHHYVRS